MPGQPVARGAECYACRALASAHGCLRQDIPVPPRGHWAKAAARQLLTRPALQPRPVRRHVWRASDSVLGPRAPAAAPTEVDAYLKTFGEGPETMSEHLTARDVKLPARVLHTS